MPALENGVYLIFPKTDAALTGAVVLTLVQTATGGGTMLDAGVWNVPTDLDTAVQDCAIPEAVYVLVLSGAIFHEACNSCKHVTDCAVTGLRVR